MYGIAAAKGAGGRKDMIWLNPQFSAKAFPFGHTSFHLGGTFASVPVAVSSQARRPLLVAGNQQVAARVQTGAGGALLTNRLDVFGLGLDYAMYHKTLWGDYKDETGPWENLGGIFTSSPAALAWGAGRVDVFGLGTDHA
ncbi:MAG: hypothetical protein M3Y28_11545, partial [Armatimonadota bacterium]|nr:hypothetical protein [Armatimonadota bacterium]